MNSPPLVFMFSGQGSHYYQMGRELFDRHPTFRESMLTMDVIVRDLSGVSVIQSLYESGRPKSEVFDQVLLTHPAIFMVEHALAQSLIGQGVIPDMTLGASLGTFAAAVTSGSLSLEDALSMIVRQAQAFQQHCEPGGMLAVLADPTVHLENWLSDKSALAGVNFATHFIVSARQFHIPEIESHLRRRNIASQRLPVSFAFHSEWIDSAASDFALATRSIQWRTGAIPVICCERTEALERLSPDHVWQVVRRPIRFREAIEKLERIGAHRYVDAGPAGTLATFLKYSLPPNTGSTIRTVLSPYARDMENFRALVSACNR